MDGTDGGDEIAAHVEQYHAFTADELRPMVDEHNRLVEDVPEIRDVVERIINVLEGKPEFDLQGHEMPRTGGMRGKQEMIERDLSNLKHDANGGRGFTIRNRDKLIIGTIAAVPSLAALIIAAIAVSNSGVTP